MDIKKMFDEVVSNAKIKFESKGIQFDQDKINIFNSTCEELIKFKKQYESKIEQLRKLSEKVIVRKEYSKAGSTIHRGFYCPSLVYDLVVGNAKRGRLLKRTPSYGRYTYEYGFDGDDKLIMVRHVNVNEEYLIYMDNIVYGLEYDNLGNLNAVSKCTYENGKLLKYERSLLDVGIEGHSELHTEEYKYQDKKLEEVSLYYNFDTLLCSYEELKYNVEQDANGRITKLIGGFVNNGVWEQDVFLFEK